MKISNLLAILNERGYEILYDIPKHLDSDIYFYPEDKVGLISINKAGWNDDQDLVFSKIREMV
jgi:hypothetical protein